MPFQAEFGDWEFSLVCCACLYVRDLSFLLKVLKIKEENDPAVCWKQLDFCHFWEEMIKAKIIQEEEAYWWAAVFPIKCLPLPGDYRFQMLHLSECLTKSKKREVGNSRISFHRNTVSLNFSLTNLAESIKKFLKCWLCYKENIAQN